MSEKFKKLVSQLSRLPGIGQRQATRLVLALVDWPENEVKNLSESINSLKTARLFCDQCFNLSDNPLCPICSNPKRLQSKIAVVEKITDLQSMERAGVYDGVYHVLGGSINSSRGDHPEKLKIGELKNRIESIKENIPPENIEIIIATGANAYGETTALFLNEELKPLSVRISRLGKGLAAGSSIEYADETTLSNALKHRK